MAQRQIYIDRSSETSLVVCNRCGRRRLWFDHEDAKRDMAAHTLMHAAARKREIRAANGQEVDE